MTGKVVKMMPEKRFGFIQVGPKQFFFHQDDLVGITWYDLYDRFSENGAIQVECTEVHSLKGPRVENIKVI
jgi:cold shock CspA family protein